MPLRDFDHSPKSTESAVAAAAAMSNPETIPKGVPTLVGPKLHQGVCEKHGNYKIHHCLTHNVFICSDCVVAYHMERCKIVPISKHLNDKKDGLCKKIDSRISCLQETRRQFEQYDKIVKDCESQINTRIEKLRSEIDELTLQIDIHHSSASNFKDLIIECEDRQNQAQLSKKDVQNFESFLEISNETQQVDSTNQNIQEWIKPVRDRLSQCFEEILTSGAFVNMASVKDIYATHIHNGLQRWGRIQSKDGLLLMQDFGLTKPPTEAIVINLSDVMDNLTSPRQVYLTFSSKDTWAPLGRVIIKVNDEEVPRRAEQLVTLCIGHTGSKYSSGGGYTELGAGAKGKPNEYIYIKNYRSYHTTGMSIISNSHIVTDLEKEKTITHKQGLLLKHGGDTAGLRILTKMGKGSCKGPALGEVVSGLPDLKNIIGDDLIIEGAATKQKVYISESGLIIYSSG